MFHQYFAYNIQHKAPAVFESSMFGVFRLASQYISYSRGLKPFISLKVIKASPFRVFQFSHSIENFTLTTELQETVSLLHELIS
jgi:hypothetical protein